MIPNILGASLNKVDTGALSVFSQVRDLWNGGKAESLVDYTAVSRVEPIVLVDAAALHLSATPLVMQSCLSLFLGYYMQAMAISTTIGNIDVFAHLDRLNPSRRPGDSATHSAQWLLATENYKHRLPHPGNQVAMEAEQKNTAVAFGRDTAQTLRELADLSVGKQVQVEITDGKHKASIPIQVRLLASTLPTSSLVHILSQGSENLHTARERWHGWRSGQLEFIKDIVLANDLIDAHRKGLMNDKSNAYADILARRRKNQLSTFLSANPSVATASNIAVLTSETAAQVESAAGGKLASMKIRDKIFKDTYLMIMAVIDPEWGRVTFYHRGIAEATTVSESAMKAATKGSGPDLSDILKAYQLGQAPSF